MHCEKCGSADTEVVKCPKCGQKSRIQCANCAFSSCTDKYCEVISIKRKIKILTYFAVALIVLMVFVLPVIIMRALEEEDPTKQPTAVASATTTPPATQPATTPPPPPPPATAPEVTDDPMPPGPSPEEQVAQASQEIEKLVAAGTPFKAGSSDPSSGGIGFAEFVVHVLKAGGIDVPVRIGEMEKAGRKITSIDEIEAGDIVFFSIKRNNRANFVGVATGGGKFACVYPKKKAMELALSNKFFKPRFMYGVRVTE